MTSQKFYEQKIVENDHYYMNVCFDHFNKRIRIDDYRGNLPLIAEYIIKTATKQHYSKAIIYTRREHVHVFVEKGFLLEAIFEGFFHGSHAYALTMYFEEDRKHNDYWVKEDEILHKVLKDKAEKSNESLLEGFNIRKGSPSDAEDLANLYNKVFKIYPTPLNNPDYIREVMSKDTIFYCIENKDGLVSAASACMNDQYYHAEITDCATLPSFRKLGLMRHLIIELEKEMKEKRIFCVFSIARALSFGMNAVLKQLNYKYKGRMTNNCYIFDKLEDMNVWVKDLS